MKMKKNISLTFKTFFSFLKYFQPDKDYLDKTDGSGTSVLPLCYINYLETLLEITALIKLKK